MASSEASAMPIGVAPLQGETERLDGIVLAAGFEQRARKVLEEGIFRKDAICILIRFVNNVPGNDEVFEDFRRLAGRRFEKESIHVIEARQDAPAAFEADLANHLSRMPRSVQLFGIDISGMPAYVICMALKALRTRRAENPLTVLYTAAVEYNPTHDEYRDLIGREGGGDLELLPRSMALEMGGTLILDSFSGYRSRNARSCLVVLAGYEAHRSTGVVESVNPSLLLIVYGSPGDHRLSWRLDLSQRLHRKFESSRRAATEVVSTLQFEQTIRVLETYYDYLVDDYDLVISPVGSKMQTLATYLFWERYPEVQLNFPLPIGYDPTRSPTGMGTTYAVSLPPSRVLFHDVGS